jgi:DNA-directed RNA polymerase specialized sigma24 family protein
MKSKTRHYLDSIDPFSSRFIRAKVRQLIRQGCFTAEDREDLMHDFAADLLHRKLHYFDPKDGTWEAFVVVVCQNRVASILIHQRAEMRYQRASSLDESTDDADGIEVRIGETLADDCHERRTGCRPRSWIDAADLAMDLAEFLATLTPKTRAMCDELMATSISEAARQIRITRVSAHARLNRIRLACERSDLREYL